VVNHQMSVPTARPTRVADLSVEIAHGWGFADMTHFGRKFRAAYGASPREYRKGALVGAS
jgi:AraC family transcriptional regulator, positive regulator of tynA and feaB